MSYGRMVTEDTRLKKEVEALLQKAATADAQDDAAYGRDRRGDELPTEVVRREQWLKIIRACQVFCVTDCG